VGKGNLAIVHKNYALSRTRDNNTIGKENEHYYM
jgi:hypothetical protein